MERLELVNTLIDQLTEWWITFHRRVMDPSLGTEKHRAQMEQTLRQSGDIDACLVMLPLLRRGAAPVNLDSLAVQAFREPLMGLAGLMEETLSTRTRNVWDLWGSIYNLRPPYWRSLYPARFAELVEKVAQEKIDENHILMVQANAGSVDGIDTRVPAVSKQVGAGGFLVATATAVPKPISLRVTAVWKTPELEEREATVEFVVQQAGTVPVPHPSEGWLCRGLKDIVVLNADKARSGFTVKFRITSAPGRQEF
jgi:hypothetical protein